LRLSRWFFLILLMQRHTAHRIAFLYTERGARFECKRRTLSCRQFAEHATEFAVVTVMRDQIDYA
jgi:hypothetical protein